MADIKFGASSSGSCFRLEANQFLPQPRERIFEFFSDACQLENLTPGWLSFSVLTPRPIRVVTGTIIDYRLKLHGIPLRWQSEISLWEPPLRFADRQIRGPYRRWHHEHSFEPVQGGTLCHDIVEYDVIGGKPIHAVFVKPDLVKIFSYRQERLAQIFGRSKR